MVIDLIRFARATRLTQVRIGPDGPYLQHPWWAPGLRQQLKTLAAAKPAKTDNKEKSNA